MTKPLTKDDYTPGGVTVHRDPERLRRVTRALRSAGRNIALVPTMGALHEGHRRLIREAHVLQNTVVVVSVFVNPTQFGEAADLERYPRDLDADVEVCRQERAPLVFAPEVATMYPAGSQVTLDPGPLGSELEGASRPGHFAGVLTVVSKLFNVVQPDYALFGEKDYQQLSLIGRMATDLNVPTAVVGVPTVRESDGLALSSRNRFLSESERESATALSAALVAGSHVSALGAEAVLSTARATLDAVPGLDLDYLELRAPDLGPAPVNGDARLLVAARVGSTRLIDNVPVLLGAGDE
ncbi:pantoate--beta-alanine ligase [Actinosynnema mirum]|uniref:Pantothenate synthetase n=1 Tax=Actinosynnema mirum (strain ATCC 29888 / DSM 43827 / JCM 3225 / NBRC 14064 / NCIMB 13271 / NRRL B-12336 / IMRU 3971 / 101) TaxID=446462 RepID=C6WGH8_ACTMD|nr:pantoate--beta-alanine ligase [Actinosynnema mirum]ACU34294.1 pantoate/beta-alanine ligase [Actinosynnema mirum DSM 43827]